ncbi:phosphoesterase RecJ-like protein [Mycoplasmoides fastidiosum]|uniref:Phosphoesterase RecJ-like protein n=1 Tax=Mycoplasmoides fastidiosum TaxID=92758 RepID=A0ABU0LYL7_9BACT|nr:bifunctional oligoribonuclease/PAP phosphatase NrnA [Mycoplasmoides fastidiosum]MDQ0513803.1 phosphoesterase RecJ-like protein [Mycoplasmoides fastidiosum]UUD37779.1 bifunctional oligoribonuclease/PAP phosphatase NrnA [Mycoplasmoides fastidiosum]
MDWNLQGSNTQIVKAISEADNIFIFHHIRPDGDCLGSQFGLKELIKINFPTKNVFCLGDSKNIFSFMNFEMDDFNQISKDQINHNSLAIVVDASSANRIEAADILVNENFTKRLRIDHHPNNHDVDYDYFYVDSKYVACCEQILDLVKQYNWKINRTAANFLYLGINTDSGRFNYEKVGVLTFDLMTWLFENVEFDYFWINNQLKQRSLKELQFAAHVLSNFQKKNQVCWYTVTEAILQKYDLTENEGSNVNLIANIDDSLVWLFFIETSENRYRCRLRSNGIKVNEIARFFGGGGHDFAAGTIILREQQEELLTMIYKTIDEYN